MSDYEKAMMHVELALLRVRDNLRSGGETNIEDALDAVSKEIASLAYEERCYKRTPGAVGSPVLTHEKGE